MSNLSVSSRRLLRWIPALTLGCLVLLAACASEQYPQTTLIPRADTARDEDHIFRLTLWIAMGVFVLVEGALLVAIWKFRDRPGAQEPVQTHGNTTLEIVWTIIPAFILAMIAVPTVRTIFKTAAKPVGDDVLQVEVIGHQWWWEFRYPQLGITTAGQLMIPVGRTVNLEMTTVDVLHAFWLPQFAGKRDVFPNRYNNLWFKAEVSGSFPAQCTEFCGIQHGRMAYRIVSVDGPAFDAWAANFNAPPKDFVADSSANALIKQGQGLFVAKACSGCHSMYPALPLVGPNLHHIGSRQYVAAGTLLNTDDNLAKWIQHPQAWKKGVLMPELGLTDDETHALVAYLRANQ